MKMLIYIKEIISKDFSGTQPLFHVPSAAVRLLSFDGFSIRKKCVRIVSFFIKFSKDFIFSFIFSLYFGTVCFIFKQIAAQIQYFRAFQTVLETDCPLFFRKGQQSGIG